MSVLNFSCQDCDGTGVVSRHVTDGIGIGLVWVPCESCKKQNSARIVK